MPRARGRATTPRVVCHVSSFRFALFDDSSYVPSPEKSRAKREENEREAGGTERTPSTSHQSPSHFCQPLPLPFPLTQKPPPPLPPTPSSPSRNDNGQTKKPQAGRDNEQSGDRFAKTAKKALSVNLNPLWYGVFAEIGAGQEVARWFFRVGAAAGTIAKSVSAYDMLISDTMYGAAAR